MVSIAAILKKSILRHNSAGDRLIETKFGLLMQNHMPMTTHRSKLKHEIEFQYGDLKTAHKILHTSSSACWARHHVNVAQCIKTAHKILHTSSSACWARHHVNVARCIKTARKILHTSSSACWARHQNDRMTVSRHVNVAQCIKTAHKILHTSSSACWARHHVNVARC